jgi:hypothetical protein
MSPLSDSLNTERLRDFYVQITANIELAIEYTFLDEQNATVSEINTLSRVINSLRDAHIFEDNQIITNMLEKLVNAKRRAESRLAAPQGGSRRRARYGKRKTRRR